MVHVEMGVGLQPLEFTDCLSDSPQFRENLQKHEKELEKTSQQIKRLIKEVKDTVQAAKRLSAAQLALATSMEQFEFECIGQSMTEDELVISRSLAHFAHLIRTIEDERERMLGRAHEQIIQPLERFRKDHIGAVKEGKKKFEKKTAKFCQSQERTLGLSTKKPDNVFQEADALMDMAERDFCQASLEYVFLLQAVQERKKFEFVETLLGFVFGWWTFYHQAHEVHKDAEPYMKDLQLRIQRTRTNFEETSKQTESLMKKMMEMRQQSKEEEERAGTGAGGGSGPMRSGYLFLMERKAFGTTWSKQYCIYERAGRTLTLIPYNQMNAKAGGCSECICLVVSGARRGSEGEKERRFLLEVAAAEGRTLTLQALSDLDRGAWMRAINDTRCEGGEAEGETSPREGGVGGVGSSDACTLDDAGFAFARNCITVLESRGLEEQGLYRVAGVASKVQRLVIAAMDPRRSPPSLEDPLEWESKTITSALKNYLRSLPEPLMTHRLHSAFIGAAKRESRSARVAEVQALVQVLPRPNYEMLELLIKHLRNVVSRCDKNLMSSGNVAVCFGPTLLWPERETVASIMDLKFYNVLVETLIDNYERIFKSASNNLDPNGHIHVGAGAPACVVGSLRHPGITVTSAAVPLTTPGPGSSTCTQSPPPPPHHMVTGRVLPPHIVGHHHHQQQHPHQHQNTKMAGVDGGRYSPHHVQLLQQLQLTGSAPAPPPPPPPPPHRYQAPHDATRVAGSAGLVELERLYCTSSSGESASASSSSGSPPPPLTVAATAAGGLLTYHHHHPLRAHLTRATRVRTLYACLGESEGELSFEPNQIITNVKASAEPGWLEGTLNGKTGLVPENYVEALP